MKKWKDKPQPDAEAEKERAEKEDAAFEVLNYYSLESGSAAFVDEVRNQTPYIWYSLKPGAGLADAVERIADCAAWAERNGRWTVVTLLRPVIVLDSFDVPEEEKAKIFPICREWGIRLFRPAGQARFEDCETGERFRLEYSGTYPGMADDAATYQDVYLEPVEAANESPRPDEER